MEREKTIKSLWNPRLAFILAVSAAIHMVYLKQFQDTPYSEILMVDAEAYHLHALKLLKEGWLGDSVFYQAPLYPYFLAVLYKLSGPKPFFVQCVQVFFSVANIGLIYWLGKILFDENVGLLSAALSVFYGVFLFQSLLLLKETLSIFFGCLFLAACLGNCESFAPRRFFASGFLLGINITLRENYFLVFFGMVFWTFAFFPARAVREKTAAVLSLTLGLSLVIVPIAARNYYVGKDLVLTSYQGGTNFFLGNNPSASGLYAFPDFVRPHPEFEETDFSARAEILSGRTLKPSEVSRFWFRQGLDFAVREPLRFLYLTAQKLFLFFNNHEIRDNYDYYYVKTLTPVLNLGFIPFGFVLVSAALGMYLRGGRTPVFRFVYIFLMVYALSAILFYVHARLRSPFVPPLFPFASYCLLHGREKLPLLNRRWMILFVGIFLIASGLAFRPFSASDFVRNRLQIGYGYEKLGKTGKAVAEYEKAIADEPDGAEARILLGLVYQKKGEAAKALREFEEAVRAKPDFPGGYWHLGKARVEQGFLREALETYEAAAKKFPHSAEARVGLGYVLHLTGDAGRAIDLTRQAIELDPYFAEAHYNLGGFYLLAKNFGAASDHFKLAAQYGATVEPEVWRKLLAE